MSMNDPDEDHVTILNLAVQTRLKYGKGIHDLLQMQYKQTIKNIEKENTIKYLSSDETIKVPTLIPLSDESDKMHKKMISQLTRLKQQMRMMNIINKNKTCPIAQVIDKL